MSVVSPHFVSIIEEISNGSSLSRALRSRGLSFGAFYDYIDADRARGERYARARNCCAEVYFDEIVTIADECREGGENVAKVRIDSRKFTVARMRPDKYGDSVHLKHSGNVGLRQLIITDDDKTEGE